MSFPLQPAPPPTRPAFSPFPHPPWGCPVSLVSGVSFLYFFYTNEQIYVFFSYILFILVKYFMLYYPVGISILSHTTLSYRRRCAISYYRYSIDILRLHCPVPSHALLRLFLRHAVPCDTTGPHSRPHRHATLCYIETLLIHFYSWVTLPCAYAFL